MRGSLHRLLIAASLILVIVAVPGSGSAATLGGPFYVIPSPAATKECAKLAFCYGIRGLWVVVPAHGEATYLMSCPVREKSAGQYLLAGTDSLTTSKHVSVWFDGQLGSPIGPPSSASPALLFHAESDNGSSGAFQPVLGCVSLRQASKRSTVSAVQARPEQNVGRAPSLRPRARLVLLEPGSHRQLSTSCLAREILVGDWSAVAFGTSGPPDLPHAPPARIERTEHGKTVVADIHTNSSVPHLIWVQVGALCEPRT